VWSDVTASIEELPSMSLFRLRQGGEIDDSLHLSKGITQGIHLFCPPIPGKEIVLDGCPACDPLSISPTI
jgi:hypothetical protein